MRKGNTQLVDNGNINAWQDGELGSKHKRAAAAAAARQSCWFELLYINFQIPGAALKEKAIRHWNRKTYSHAAQMIASRRVDWIINGKGRARAKEMRGMRRNGGGELWRIVNGKRQGRAKEMRQGYMGEGYGEQGQALID
ncbi:hypothetical protein ACLOJK_028979 [Asimina triloba]